jgi:hypothetical protein
MLNWDEEAIDAHRLVRESLLLSLFPCPLPMRRVLSAGRLDEQPHLPKVSRTERVRKCSTKPAPTTSQALPQQ